MDVLYVIFSYFSLHTDKMYEHIFHKMIFNKVPVAPNGQYAHSIHTLYDYLILRGVKESFF